MWIIILVLLNAVLGAVMLELAWASTQMHRTVDEKRDSKFPAWRRLDTKKWNKIAMYPLAVTVLPIRFFGFVAAVGLINIAHQFLLWGHDMSKPIPTNIRNIGKKVYKYCSFLTAMSIGLIIRPRYVDADYSYWLGPDYKREKVYPQNRRVVNFFFSHISFADIPTCEWTLNGDIAFLAGDFLKNYPIVGFLVGAADGLFAPRGGTPEEKQMTVDLIKNRQESVQNGTSTQSPLIIYPEGSTSNNTHIVKFKRGAFESLLPV